MRQSLKTLTVNIANEVTNDEHRGGYNYVIFVLFFNKHVSICAYVWKCTIPYVLHEIASYFYT